MGGKPRQGITRDYLRSSPRSPEEDIFRASKNVLLIRPAAAASNRQIDKATESSPRKGFAETNQGKAHVQERRFCFWGVEISDEILMWKLYNYNTIKNIAINDVNLNKDRLVYLSVVLNTNINKFKCHKNILLYERLQEIAV
jgi:hypothetical protein